MSGGQRSGSEKPAAARRPCSISGVHLLCSFLGAWDTPPPALDQSQLPTSPTPPRRGRAWTLGSGGKVTGAPRETRGGGGGGGGGAESANQPRRLLLPLWSSSLPSVPGAKGWCCCPPSGLASPAVAQGPGQEAAAWEARLSNSATAPPPPPLPLCAVPFPGLSLPGWLPQSVVPPPVRAEGSGVLGN